MDAEVLKTIAARLEFRGTDDGYGRLSQPTDPSAPNHAQRTSALAAAPASR